MSLFYTENEVKKLEIANELGSVAGENISSC